MTALLRSASLTHFAAVAERFGLDAPALLAAAGLPLRCLHEPDLMVPARAVAQVLELAAQRAGEPAFALLMVEQRRLSNLGPLALLLRDEPTLRSALVAVAHHLHLHNEAMQVNVEQTGNLVVLRLEMAPQGPVPLHQASELALGVMYRVLAIFMGAHWRARLVCFSHPAPPSLRHHRRLFGPAVEFGHAFCGIVCNAADLDAPNPGADPVMASYSKRLLQVNTQREVAMAERVRQLIVLLLPHGHCRVDVVAQHLGVDRRTVARRLGAEGTSFSALLDGVRSDLVARYLQARQPLAEVAALLGFSAPSAFSRWHRGRFGTAARARAAR